MSVEANKLGVSPQPNRVGLSIVPKNGESDDHSGLLQTVVRCASCLRQVEHADGQQYCGNCGTKAEFTHR